MLGMVCRHLLTPLSERNMFIIMVMIMKLHIHPSILSFLIVNLFGATKTGWMTGGDGVPADHFTENEKTRSQGNELNHRDDSGHS